MLGIFLTQNLFFMLFHKFLAKNVILHDFLNSKSDFLVKFDTKIWILWLIAFSKMYTFMSGAVPG